MNSEKNNISVISKSWGFEKIICNQQYGGKLTYVIKGKQTAVHYHNSRDKTFYMLKGRLLVYYSNSVVKIKEIIDSGREDEVFELLEKITLTIGDSLHIPPKTAHCLVGLEDSEVIEFSNKYNDADFIQLASGD